MMNHIFCYYNITLPTMNIYHPIFQLLCWHGKKSLRSQFNHLILLGVNEVWYIVDARPPSFLDFVEVREGRGFGVFCLGGLESYFYIKTTWGHNIVKSLWTYGVSPMCLCQGHVWGPATMNKNCCVLYREIRYLTW